MDWQAEASREEIEGDAEGGKEREGEREGEGGRDKGEEYSGKESLTPLGGGGAYGLSTRGIDIRHGRTSCYRLDLRARPGLRQATPGRAAGTSAFTADVQAAYTRLASTSRAAGW